MRMEVVQLQCHMVGLPTKHKIGIDSVGNTHARETPGAGYAFNNWNSILKMNI